MTYTSFVDVVDAESDYSDTRSLDDRLGAHRGPAAGHLRRRGPDLRRRAGDRRPTRTSRASRPSCSRASATRPNVEAPERDRGPDRRLHRRAPRRRSRRRAAGRRRTRDAKRRGAEGGAGASRAEEAKAGGGEEADPEERAAGRRRQGPAVWGRPRVPLAPRRSMTGSTRGGLRRAPDIGCPCTKPIPQARCSACPGPRYELRLRAEDAASALFNGRAILPPVMPLVKTGVILRDSDLRRQLRAGGPDQTKRLGRLRATSGRCGWPAEPRAGDLVPAAKEIGSCTERA